MSRIDSQCTQGEELLSNKMLGLYRYFSNNVCKITQISPYEKPLRVQGELRNEEK